MANFIKVNGIYIPTPASFEWQMARAIIPAINSEPRRLGTSAIIF